MYQSEMYICSSLRLIDGHDDVDAEDDPEDHHQESHRPFEFGVLLRAVHAESESDRRQGDDNVEEPELEPGEAGAPEPGPGQALGYVEEEGHEAADPPAEDAGVGVDRAEPAVGQVGGEVQLREGQLERDQHPEQHRHQSPDNAPGNETLDDIIGITFLLIHGYLLNIDNIRRG